MYMYTATIMFACFSTTLAYFVNP